jgi:hypothetical protein
LNSTDPLGLESEKQFLTYLSHHKKQTKYFKKTAVLSKKAIREYISGSPQLASAKWVVSHKWEFYAAPVAIGAGTLLCAAGGCEALAAPVAATVEVLPTVSQAFVIGLAAHGVADQLEQSGEQSSNPFTKALATFEARLLEIGDAFHTGMEIGGG